MTTDQLIKANFLNERIKSTKSLLNEVEGGKITCITIRCFDDNKTEFHDRELRADLPKNAIKSLLVAQLKTELANLQKQFDEFLNPSFANIQIAENYSEQVA